MLEQDWTSSRADDITVYPPYGMYVRPAQRGSRPSLLVVIESN